MFSKATLRFGLITASTGSIAIFLAISVVSAGNQKTTGSGGSGTFSITGSMNFPRFGHQAVPLGTGQVLVVGGVAGNTNLNTAELYNPVAGKWTLTGSTAVLHQRGTLTRLSNGDVLLAGGDPVAGGFNNPCTAAAELFNPMTGNWTTTGSMTSARCYHTATLLPTGQVLVTGGSTSSNGDSLASAELYNPATATWQATRSLHVSRLGAAAELLGSGKVLVASGEEFVNGTATRLTSAEIFDPSQGLFTLTGSMSSPGGSLASLLANGNVLVVGDAFFTPATGTWTNTGSFPRGVGGGSTATLLGTGNMLLTGFIDTYQGSGFPPLNFAFLYEFSTNSYVSTGGMNASRNEDTATLLPNGQVLVAGGYNKGPSSGGVLNILSSAELYTP